MLFICLWRPLHSSSVSAKGGGEKKKKKKPKFDRVDVWIVPVSECRLQNVRLSASRCATFRLRCAFTHGSAGIAPAWAAACGAAWGWKEAADMDFLLSVTGTGARVVRDAISQRLWPGAEQHTVRVQPMRARPAQQNHANPSDTG